MGLMQLMPGTWVELRDRHGFGADPDDPAANIAAGAAYLAEMHGQFGYPGLFAAYNAGPGRYARHLVTGAPLPAETRAYLAAVAPEAGTLVSRVTKASNVAASIVPATTGASPDRRLVVVAKDFPRIGAEEPRVAEAPVALFAIRRNR